MKLLILSLLFMVPTVHAETYGGVYKAVVLDCNYSCQHDCTRLKLLDMVKGKRRVKTTWICPKCKRKTSIQTDIKQP